MKKPKILMAAGGLILAITAVLTTKASRKFISPTSATFQFTGTYTTPSVTMSLPTGVFTTTSAANNCQVYIGLFTECHLGIFRFVPLLYMGKPIYK